MRRKEILSTLSKALVKGERKPPLGISQGRGWRDERGARVAAFQSTPNRWTGTDLGEDHGSEPAVQATLSGAERASEEPNGNKRRYKRS